MTVHGKAMKGEDGSWSRYRSDCYRSDGAWSGWNSNDNSMM